jgi:phytoene dehydrogenase-like protein
VVDALVRGVERHGGAVRTRAPVARILVEEQRAVGVMLRDCEVIRASRGVIANTSPWDLVSLLPAEAVPARWRRRQSEAPACRSFLHWHLALRASPAMAALPIHHVWVGDWQRGIDAERNMAVLSMPSLLDPGLAPTGHHLLHGYTPANEPWELWAELERGSPAYRALKAERCSLFHGVLERLLPGWQELRVLELQGTPLTHQHYLRVHQGSYGPAWPADQGPFPGGGTPIEGLVLCGAGVFPGIGVPPVAVSGAAAAHRFVTARQQRRLLEDLELAA